MSCVAGGARCWRAARDAEQAVWRAARDAEQAAGYVGRDPEPGADWSGHEAFQWFVNASGGDLGGVDGQGSGASHVPSVGSRQGQRGAQLYGAGRPQRVVCTFFRLRSLIRSRTIWQGLGEKE